jgi:hypothetical protein
MATMRTRLRTLLAIATAAMVSACNPGPTDRFAGNWRVEGTRGSMEIVILGDHECELRIETGRDSKTIPCTYSVKDKVMSLAPLNMQRLELAYMPESDALWVHENPPRIMTRIPKETGK